ncbi:hypothetical protein V6N00_03920 [Tersicoccus sp. MR15.9]|uniref:hypothetical protein n=1 Tax=Tersicoccus mangrovi TaxID=3121635 RepID=UPI002FE59DD9
MTTISTTTDTRPHSPGRTGLRAVGFAIGIVWAWLFGAAVTIPLALPSGVLVSPYETVPTGQPQNGVVILVFLLAVVLALGMAALIRYRPALLGGVALGLAAFLVVGWAIGPWFGVGPSLALVNPVGYTSTIARDPAVVAVFALVIGLAVMRGRRGRDRA